MTERREIARGEEIRGCSFVDSNFVTSGDLTGKTQFGHSCPPVARRRTMRQAFLTEGTFSLSEKAGSKRAFWRRQASLSLVVNTRPVECVSLLQVALRLAKHSKRVVPRVSLLSACARTVVSLRLGNTHPSVYFRPRRNADRARTGRLTHSRAQSSCALVIVAAAAAAAPRSRPQRNIVPA